MSKPQFASLSGAWQGRYTYFDSADGEAFSAQLVELSDTLTGTTSETVDMRDGLTGPRQATLTGSRNGAHVSFVKRYLPGQGHDLPIKYTGEVNDDATEIEGDWIIPGRTFGRFLMIRDTEMSEPSVAREASEVVR
ncbi:MAG TPA: hypothetical protein DCL54_12845 [Alphaproteobacteria bacterium]|nr:hypothetical protein [Alphaproteobacteria bacterium]